LFLKLRPTVVHTNTIVMPTPALAARLTGRRHIWHVRELLGEFGALWKPFQRFVYVFSGTIIAISNCTRDQFETPLRDKIRVIYDGLDETSSVALHDLRPSFRAGLPEFALLVGVVGRIKFHRKGQEILVRAASLLRRRHPEARYLVIGSASPGNEDQVLKLRRLIDELGVGDIVSLPGEFDDPPSIFSALDIAVVPSVQPEPFGCVVMEAMAVGTPVIGSDCGGIAEQIVDGQSGLLFAPGNAQALADSLDRLLSDPSFCRELAVNARHRVKTCFSLNATYQLLAEVVQGVDTMRHAAMRT